MALSVSQIISASYNDVVNESRKPANQWAEASAMREFEKQGLVDRIPGGPQIEVTLDYKRNEGAEFQTTDLQDVSTAKTDILTAALYDVAQFSAPIVWSRADEAKNPTTNQKVALVKSLLSNALDTHDDVFEQALFAATATNGFSSLPVIIPTNGQGTIGGIDSGTETWWRNQATSYASDYSTLLATMTTVYNNVMKGSGSTMGAKFLLSGSTVHAAYEAKLQANQRFVDSSEADGGFKVLAFKNLRYVFSKEGGTSIYFLGKSISLKVFKGSFRLLTDTQEFPQNHGFIRKIFSMAQLVTNNKSRLGVAYSA